MLIWHRGRGRGRAHSQGPFFMIVENVTYRAHIWPHLPYLPAELLEFKPWPTNFSRLLLSFSFNSIVMRKVGRVYRGPREEMFKESLLWAAADHGPDDERSCELHLRSWLWELHRWEAAEQLEVRVGLSKDLSGFWMKNWLNRGKWKLKEQTRLLNSVNTSDSSSNKKGIRLDFLIVLLIT